MGDLHPFHMVPFMLCNAAASNATIVFRIGLATTAALRFGECDYLPLQTGEHDVKLTSSAGIDGAGQIVVLSSRGRSYAAAYNDGSAALRVIAPSPAFKEELPNGWDRFVWANLCPLCGNVSAFVSNYRKQINRPSEPMACCGTAIDETEGPPGPPAGAVGVFTQFRPGSPGPPVAPICFPWKREQYDGREAFQMLLANNLTMTLLWGYEPVVYGPATCPPPAAAPDGEERSLTT